jgi:hypothetical protein
MRQALHIFKKDVRGHWYELALVLAVTAVFAFIGSSQAAFWRYGGLSRSIAATLVLLVLPLSWWVLIARVIHAEALPGDRQFWLTRPYNRGSLLGAKALFILLSINVPMLLADAFIVSAYDFPVSSVLPGLLWSQVLLTAVFVLPIAALSAITTGLVQLLLTVVAVAAVILAWVVAVPGNTLTDVWARLEWVRIYYAILVSALAAIAIVLWQYASRKTAATRLLAATTAILLPLGTMLIPWTTAFSLQSKFSDQRFDVSDIQMVLSAERSWAGTVVNQADFVRLTIPVAFKGIPDGVSVVPAGLVATFQTSDGTIRTSDYDPWRNLMVQGQIAQLQATLNKSFYERVRGMPITVRGTFYITLFGNSRRSRLAFGNRSSAVPGVGRCTATTAPNGQNYFLVCQSAFRDPKDDIQVNWVDLAKGVSHRQGLAIDQSYSPFPADLGISPVNQYSTYSTLQGPASVVDIYTTEPLAYIQREFELQGVRLADYEQR